MFAFSWNPIDWIKTGLGQLSGLVSGAANGLLGDIFEWLSSLLLRGVMWLFDVVYDFISEQTTPDLAASWFQAGPMAIAQRLGGMLLMLFVFLAIAETVWNRDGGQMLRSLGQDAPLALFKMIGITFMTTLGLGAADGVSTWIMGLFSDNVTAFTDKMAEMTAELSFGAGVLVIVLMALFLMIVLIFVALELVFREAFILILVPIYAVLLTTEVYRPTKGMGSRTGRLLIVTIATKPMVALCLVVGAVALGQQAASVTSVDAVAEPGTGPHEITDEQLATWQDLEFKRCITGMDASKGLMDVVGLAEIIEASNDATAIKEQCRSEIVVAERCCNALDFSAPGVLRSDPWRETVVTGGDQDIDGVDTTAVAPTFGLVMAGLAAMMIAAFSPFLLAKLLSTDPAASTGEARGAVGGSMTTAKSSVTSATAKVGGVAKKAGG